MAAAERHAGVLPAERILPLQVHNLRFVARGQPLIDDVTFTLDAAPPTVILGPNGAGKSLLLRLCHGLLEPSGGAITWGGLPPAAARRWQAMVFQRPVLLRRSVAGNVAYALKVNGCRGAACDARVAEALDQAGLAALARRPAAVLSGGEQQRLALARAWALRPQVLLLDEPTASLDPSATRAVEDLVRAIDAGGTRIVMTTHDLGQARRLASDILFLHRGRLLDRAPAAVFFAQPQTAEAAAFIDGRLLW